MPNRGTHVAAGAIVGGATALVLANERPPTAAWPELAGGLLGGALGGILPDVLEPATSPNHRKLAHSVVVAGSLALAEVTEWQAACRARSAARSEAAALLPLGSRERSEAELAVLWWSFLAGLIAGFFAGYASHLALDALTPRSLPLLGM